MAQHTLQRKNCDHSTENKFVNDPELFEDENIKQETTKCGDSKVGKVHALQTANLGLIPGNLYSCKVPPGVIPEHKAMSVPLKHAN